MVILSSLPPLNDLLLRIVREIDYTLVLMVIKRLGRILISLGCQISIIRLHYLVCDRSDVCSIQSVSLVPEASSLEEESKFDQAKKGRSSGRLEEVESVRSEEV